MLMLDKDSSLPKLLFLLGLKTGSLLSKTSNISKVLSKSCKRSENIMNCKRRKMIKSYLQWMLKIIRRSKISKKKKIRQALSQRLQRYIKKRLCPNINRQWVKEAQQNTNLQKLEEIFRCQEIIRDHKKEIQLGVTLQCCQHISQIEKDYWNRWQNWMLHHNKTNLMWF